MEPLFVTNQRSNKYTMKEELIKQASDEVAKVNAKLVELDELRKAKSETDTKVAELKAAEKAILDSEDVEKLLKHRAKLDIATNKSARQSEEINAKQNETIESGINASYALSDLHNATLAATRSRLSTLLLGLFGEPRKGHVEHSLQLCEDWIVINNTLPPGFSRANAETALHDCSRLEAVLESLSKLSEKENF